MGQTAAPALPDVELMQLDQRGRDPRSLNVAATTPWLLLQQTLSQAIPSEWRSAADVLDGD
jgi:hypothetical protein